MRLLEDHPGGAGYLLKQRVSNLGVLTDALGASATANAWSTRRSWPGS